MAYLCAFCKSRGFVSSSFTLTIHLSRPSSSIGEQSPCHSHSHSGAPCTLFATPFLRLAIADPDSIPTFLLTSLLILLLELYKKTLSPTPDPSSNSSVFSYGTPNSPLLILTTPKFFHLQYLFLQVLHLPSQVSDSFPSCTENSLMP